MNIWLFSHYAIPPTLSGPTRHYDLAKALVELGHDVTIIACNVYHYSSDVEYTIVLESGQVYKHEMINGVRFVWLLGPIYRGNSIKRVWNMLVYAMRAWRQTGLKSLPPPDIVWGSSSHLFTPLAAQQVARYYVKPFILEIRDLWPQTLIDLGGYSSYHPLIVLFGIIESYLYKTAYRIVTLLPNSFDFIVSRGACHKRIVWIPNGVDFNRLPVLPESIINTTFTLTYAGGHGLANALDPILDAVELLRDQGWEKRIHIRMIGDGVLKPILQAKAKQKGLQNISFEPPQSKNEIYISMQQADAFILTTAKTSLYRWGVSMNKLYDYMAIGRPIIFSIDAPYNPIEESKAGITIPPENTQALVDAIKQLVSMSAGERREMGLRGCAYVKEHHDMMKLAEKFENVFEESIQEFNLD